MIFNNTVFKSVSNTSALRRIPSGSLYCGGDKWQMLLGYYHICLMVITISEAGNCGGDKCFLVITISASWLLPYLPHGYYHICLMVITTSASWLLPYLRLVIVEGTNASWLLPYLRLVTFTLCNKGLIKLLHAVIGSSV